MAPIILLEMDHFSTTRFTALSFTTMGLLPCVAIGEALRLNNLQLLTPLTSAITLLWNTRHCKINSLRITLEIVIFKKLFNNLSLTFSITILNHREPLLIRKIETYWRMEIVWNECPNNIILLPCVKPRIITNAVIIVSIEVPISQRPM